MSNGRALEVGSSYSVTAPEGVILPILLASDSVNQRFPSRPTAMFPSPAPSVGTGCSTIESIDAPEASGTTATVAATTAATVQRRITSTVSSTPSSLDERRRRRENDAPARFTSCAASAPRAS